nr:reverse transcriptase domain-containing protein [Tanacetum cinerariifolium]
MASDQNSSDPAPKCQTMALEHDNLSPERKCQENVSHGDKAVTTLNELDLLFSLMFDELLNGLSQVVSKSFAVTTADECIQHQQQTTPLNNHSTPAPTCQIQSIAPTVISNENINQAETHAENDQVAYDEFINIFSTPVQDQGETRSKQPFIIEESPVDTLADQRTMAELLRAPTEGYAEVIVVPPILAEQFELKHSHINMMTSDQFFGLQKDNPHDHISWFNKITSTIKYKDVPKSTIKLLLFPFSFAKATRRCKSVVSQVKACDVNSNSSSEIAKLTHAVNQQTSAVTTAMTAIRKQFQATPPPASVKAVEETCVTCGGAHPYYQCLAAGGNTFPELRDNIQGYVSAAAANYNQGNPGFRPPSVANQIRPPAPAQQNQNVHLNELEKVRRMNEANMKAMQTHIDMVKNEVRNEMKNSIQTSLSNQISEIKNMMASLLQMNTTSTLGSGSPPSNTVANPKGELKSITTLSGLVIDGPTIPTPPQSINLEVDERVEETFTDPDLAEYTIKVPPPSVKKYKSPSQREYVVHQRDPLHLNIPYPFKDAQTKTARKS